MKTTMLEFLSPGILMECDTEGCEESIEENEWIELTDFIANAKADGWKIRKVEDLWEHYCPQCAEALAF